MSQQDLTLLDATFPKGDSEPVSALDNYARETRAKLKAWAAIEHDPVTGYHHIGNAPIFPANGRIYYDEITQELRYYQNGIWRAPLEPPFNYIFNPEFALATGPGAGAITPAGWGITTVAGGSYAPNSSIRYFGRNSFQINSPAGASSQMYAYQNFGISNPRFLPIDYWRGRTVSFGCWVLADQPGRAFVQVYDDVAGGYAPSITVGAWEWISAQYTVSSGASQFSAFMGVLQGTTSCTAFFSMPTLVEGAWNPRGVPQGHPQRTHLLSFSSLNGVAEAVTGTRYYGQCGRSTNEFLVSTIIPYRFIARNLFVFVTGAPGASQSIDFRIRYNNSVDSPLTCNIAGTNVTAVDETNQLYGDPNGTLSLRATGSAAPNNTAIVASLSIDELPW